MKKRKSSGGGAMETGREKERQKCEKELEQPKRLENGDVFWMRRICPISCGGRRG